MDDRAGCRGGSVPVRQGLWLRARRLRWFVAGYLAVRLLAMIFEESLIFFPSRWPEGDWRPDNLAVEDAFFSAADGTRLHGWYVDHPSPCAVVLFSHGNAGNVTDRADWLRMLHQRVGARVMVYDYRGYGRSDGRPDEPGILADARAARAWLANRAEVAEQDIVLMGESLGSAVAVSLAAEDGAAGLALDGAFSSLVDVAAHHYPLPGLRWFMRTRLDSAAKIGRYRGPLLQSHGQLDTIVPLELGQRLFDAAGEPKRLIVMPGRDHNDFPPPSYFDELRAWLESLGAPIAG